MTRKYKILVLPGDGIAREVIPEAVRVLKAAEDTASGLNLEFMEFECGFEYYKEQGEPWSSDARSAVKKSDAILYGGRP